MTWIFEVISDLKISKKASTFLRIYYSFLRECKRFYVISHTCKGVRFTGASVFGRESLNKNSFEQFIWMCVNVVKTPLLRIWQRHYTPNSHNFWVAVLSGLLLRMVCKRTLLFTLLQPLCLRCGHCSHYRGAPSLSKMPFNEIETNESQKSLMSLPQRGQFFMRNVSWLSDLSHSIEDAIIIL